jgi:serine/threonine protein kinase
MAKGRKINEQCGTPAYIAPEILRGAGYEGFAADVWSAGGTFMTVVVLFAMLYGTVPFKASNMEELHKLILDGDYTISEGISTGITFISEAKSLIKRILVLDPKERITIPDIFMHPWFNDYDDSSTQLI